MQVEEAKRARDGKPWSEEEQAAFKAQIADRCACSSACTLLLPACSKSYNVCSALLLKCKHVKCRYSMSAIETSWKSMKRHRIGKGSIFMDEHVC